MDLRSYLQKLTQGFDQQTLINFLRAANGSFRPDDQGYEHYLPQEIPIANLRKVGQIDFTDARRLIVVTGRIEKELTSHSGKRGQYDLAKKILKDELFDAGIFGFFDGAGHFRFSLVTVQYKGTKREFSNFRRYTYFVSNDTLNRTFIDQIGKADFSNIESIVQAFSVEPVTKEFFKEYSMIFEQAEASLPATLSAEQRRLYTQKFFNRLMFLAFLERKGWMTFNGRRDYLRALFEDYWNNDKEKRAEANFHRKRLNTLFFWGLNNPRERNELDKPEYKILRNLIGDVPYLNGGLFEKEQDDEAWFFSDAITAKIIVDLIYAFNFTVTESTPLDIEVAVDPEMLGKIFEELVTGRHETGSYYTPKPVVAFMCREALEGYLSSALSHETGKAISRFVEQSDPVGLKNPEAALEALRKVRACDPACGSGAYLLGLLHELLDLRAALFATRQLDAPTVYDRKLAIIQNNLYGVDIDPFAVNIARLRLWLSLIVDFEGDTPPPLPNLDFKIEAGDSLTGPDPSGGLEMGFRYSLVNDFLTAKEQYLSCYDPGEKRRLRETIERLRQDLILWARMPGKNQSTRDIDAWIRPSSPTEKPEPISNAFDWVIEFAEIFATGQSSRSMTGQMAGVVNEIPGQMQLTSTHQAGGFDIVLTNPPYVRQELILELKPTLKRVYKDLYTGTADLYVYFYLRAHQLLRPGGVACFISSNKWLRAGYGEKLRHHLLDAQAFTTIVDFGELPVFQTAATFPAIFVWHKEKRGDKSTKWAVVKNLQECYDEGIDEYVARIAEILPASQLGIENPRIASASTANLLTQMEAKGLKLGEIIGKEFFRGVTTGYNKAFIVDEEIFDQLMRDSTSKDIVKPVIVGDHIRRFEIHYRDKYLVFTRRGINIAEYPAIHKHLLQYKPRLMPKRFSNDKLGRKPGDYKWYEIQDSTAYYPAFDKPKIIYPDIAKEPRFYLDETRIYVEATGFIIPSGEWYMLAVLNSQIAFEYLKAICSVLGDQDKGGRIRLKSIYMQQLPIPDASQSDREAMTHLAQEAQNLHTQRRVRVEKFLCEIGIDIAQSTSRNPLEQPWSLSKAEFTRRVSRIANPTYVFESAREETSSLTEEILSIEAEIDERVKSLYGLG